MKKKELTVFRKKETGDLRKILEEKRKEAREVFLRARAGQEKNIRAHKNLRREIAQILTIVKEKQIISEKEK